MKKDNPIQVRPLKRIPGGWLTADGNWQLRKSGRKWQAYRPMKDRSHITIIYPTFHHHRLKDLVLEMEESYDDQNVRPLCRRGKGLHFSHCQRFVFIKTNIGWQVGLNLKRCVFQLPGESLSLSSCQQEWMRRHGLDLPLSTLFEAVERVKLACKADSPNQLEDRYRY